MYLRRIFTLSLALTLGLLLSANAQVVVEPVGAGVVVENGDEVSTEFTLRNLGEAEVAYSIGYDVIEPDDRQNRGPRRDQPEGRGILIAERCGWNNWDFERYFQAIDDLDYERYRTWNQVEDVDFADFDFMWLGNYESEAWVAQYNNNLERIEEFVDAGGALYHSSGTNNHNTRPINPGGLVYSNTQSQNNCPLQVNPEDNWLINYMNENDEFDWEWREGQRLVGNGCAHGYFTQNDIDELENSDWHQVIALGNPTNEPIILVYEYGRGYCVVGTTVDGFLHNNEQQYHWGRTGEAIIWYLDVLGQPKWFIADPDEGVIAGGEETTFELTFTPEAIDAGVYEVILDIELSDENQPLIQVSVFVSVDVAVGEVVGTVTEAATGDPIEGVMLDFPDHHYTRWTDENGEFSFNNAPVGLPFNVVVSKADYLTQWHEVGLEEEGQVEWNLELLQATCIIEPDEIDYAVEPDFLVEGIEFVVTNDGDGPLTWDVTRHLLGDADAAPWELREEIGVGDIVEDTYLAGVVFIDGLYYVAGGNNREDENFIYILNQDGEEVDRFPQFAESRAGMRDLDWDGELIWGGDADMVYGFTPEGDLEVSFEVDISPARAIAWDPDNELLWVCAEATDLLGYDRAGNLVTVLEKQQNVSINGISYYPDDEDGYKMYIFTRDGDPEQGDSDTRVYKLNTDDGDIQFVADLDFGGRAGGLHITNQLDIYSWVFVGLLENAGLTPDVLAIWQIDVRIGWMAVEPTEGVIEAGDSEQFNMVLDARGLPVAVFEGELIFHHDGIDGETHLPITMNVTDEPVQTFRNLDMRFGWNLVSLNVEPDEDDVPTMMAPLVEAGALVMVKNGAGQFFVPALDFNNIEAWMFDEGYMVKLNQNTRLQVGGLSIVAEAAIPLTEGWNMAAYYPRRSVEATLALSGLAESDHLIIAKDGFGHFYVPEYGFSNMGLMREGRGYQYRVDADVELSYVQMMDGAPERNESLHRQIASAPRELPELPVTGLNMSLLVKADASLSGDIGVYSDGMLVGSGLLEDGMAGVAVWGDDPTTESIDGAVEGAALEVRLVRGSGSQSASFTTLSGSQAYRTDSFWAIELGESEEVLPESFGLESVYPNPFNSRTIIRYALVESSPVNLSLYDLSGRLVSSLASGVQTAGYHTASVNGMDMPSGVYIVRLQSNGQIAQQKLTLIK